MKIKVVFLSLLVLVLLSAFIPRPVSLFAVPLPDGRTLDEGHDSGYIDWSGGVGYADLFHRDGICPIGCPENVTQISSGGMVSGDFAGEVSYFEVMVAYSGAGGFGTATIQACSSSYSVYLGTGGATPGFNSFSLSVPSGCTTWSVSASGGLVYFRSVDANYSYIPPTPTLTASPTETETPTATSTSTDTPTASATATDTPTETITPSITLTSTSTFTLPPGVTPSNIPVLPNVSGPSSSSGGWQFPAIPFLSFPSPTATRVLLIPSVVPKSITPQVFSNVAVSVPSIVCGTPIPSSASTTGSDSGFPNWLLPAGFTLASALTLLNSFLKESSGGKVASLMPSGLVVSTPKVVYRKTTVGEWVTRPTRTLVLVTRTIWKTITEAVPRFINRVRQVIDRIVYSEWVTTFRQVAKTFWENVTEKVPLLGLFGKFLGFIWRTILKPVIRMVTEAIRTLQTIVKNVIRTIVEKVQDGWSYIARQVSEIIREWVEKTEWIKTWVTKEITVPEIIWEKSFFPILSFSNPSTIRHLLQLGVTVVLGAITVSQCTTPTPTPATPTPDVLATAIANAWCLTTQTAQAAFTQTVMAFTPTPAPTATAIPAPYTVTVQPGDSLSYFASLFGLTEQEIMLANGMTNNNLFAGQTLIIPVNIPTTISGVLANILQNERPTQYEFQQAWGALNVFGNPNSELYPNSWWLADGSLSVQDVMNLVMQGEVADSQYGQQAVAARYVYYCGTTLDCNGNTTKLLEFLAYYHAWRESGIQAGNVSLPPAQNIIDTTNALTGGNTAYLQQIGLSGDLSAGNKDLPFHFANVSPSWDTLLRNKLGRAPNGENKFWVLTINELQRVCPSWGLVSPDMTVPDTSQCY